VIAVEHEVQVPVALLKNMFWVVLQTQAPDTFTKEDPHVLQLVLLVQTVQPGEQGLQVRGMLPPGP
jgi:hypothetical protein